MREVRWYVEKQILTSCIFAAPQQHKLCDGYVVARTHKNGWLEEEHATPIQAHSPVKIIELY